MPIDKIIILEDDLHVRRSLENHLRSHRFEVTATNTISAAREILAKDDFDLLLLDLQLPDGGGIELLKALQDRPQKPVVIVMTGFGSVQSAVECMKSGAFDYLTKPFSTNQLDVTIHRAHQFTQLVRVNQILGRQEDEDSNELLGQSSSMEELRNLIRKVARTNATVLIQGECGTGKKLVARTICRESPRHGAPFLTIDCAAVAEDRIESHFFGHAKGAFTGATARREGRIELAHGGTLLIDEISLIPASIQTRLMRVLQERKLESPGGNKTIDVDVRVIATTSRHLEQCVARKEFLEELYFRLNIVPIRVPPLRERPEDVLFLAEQFLKRFTRKHGVRIKGFGERSRAALLQHGWPGNVRELLHVIERAVILGEDEGLIEPEQLGLVTASGPSSVVVSAPPAGGEVPAPMAGLPTLAELEKGHIYAALQHCKGNRTQTAKVLGISIRTLRNKLNQYKSESPRPEAEPGSAAR